ncbi:MAG: hypothetical protein BGO98_10000 [Myxococcales bacterium 68-20]|nr:MAG: hypothetical protein BGO98_10000 [Myxococcales bacterium 68-20]
MFVDDGETAIARALLEAHPGSKLLRLGEPRPGKRARLGCVAIRASAPVPHWLVVSRGFTELDEKVEDDPELSGWGFEITCRLPVRATKRDLAWALGRMQGVADHLADAVSFLESYHHMPAPAATAKDDIAGLVFVEDSELPTTRSRNGVFAFFQMIGLTTAEYEALGAWDCRGLVDLVRERDPLFLLESTRASYLSDPSFALAVEEGREREGSSTGALHGVAIRWFAARDELQVHLSVATAGLVRAAVKARLSHGKPMSFFGDRLRTVRPDGSLTLNSQVNVELRAEGGAAEIADAEDGGRTCLIRLGRKAVAELETVLRDSPGTYVLPSLPAVRFVVVTAERLSDPAYPR